MVAFRINIFGGMIPAQDDHVLPDGGAALAQNVWLYSGTLEGMKAPRFLRNLTSATAKRVYRIPNDPYEKTNFNNSIWMEFQDTDVDVLRAPVRDDSYQRYYWVGSSTSPSYNTYARIATGSAAYTLGIPQPGTAPSVTAPVTPPDTVSPVFASATVNGALITIIFTEERRLDAVNLPPKTAFTVTSPTRQFTVLDMAIDGDNRKVYLQLDEPAEPSEVVTVSYSDPTSGNDEFALQDEAGNDVATFSQPCTNNTVDRVGPTFDKAEASGTSVVVYFKDANNLSTTNLPATTTFKVVSDNTQIAVSSMSVNGTAKTVTLTLASAIPVGATVYVSYTDPTTSNDNNAIQDTVGNDALGFTNKLVTNTTVDTVAPQFVVAACLYSTVNISFDEALSSTIPSANLFTVVVNGVSYTPVRTVVDGVNKMVGLQLSVTTVYGDAVTVSYDAAAVGTKITDTSGNAAAGFTTKPVRNDNPYTTPYIEPYIP